MKFPKLKNALLCRILVYVVVIDCFIAPIIIVGSLNFVPDVIKIIFGFGCVAGFLVYLFKNFVLLMSLDLGLAWIHSHNKARCSFVLSKSFSSEKAIARISGFGKGYTPSSILPAPSVLRYKNSFPLSIYSKGIEKILAVYRTECLDKNEFRAIVTSAKTNSKALTGKKKHLFLDKEQKKASLNRVTIVFIFADRVDDELRDKLHKEVCRNSGDGFDNAVIPCVVDIEKGVCIFDSLRIPFNGYQYPVKNRGISIIRNYIFSGFFTYRQSKEILNPIEDLDIEQSLWEFWHDMKKELVLDKKEREKIYNSMAHGKVFFDDGYIYVKWEDKSIWQAVSLDENRKIAVIDEIYQWEYPKRHRIAKDTVSRLKNLIDTYFAQMGYTTEYLSDFSQDEQ